MIVKVGNSSYSVMTSCPSCDGPFVPEKKYLCAECGNFVFNRDGLVVVTTEDEYPSKKEILEFVRKKRG